MKNMFFIYVRPETLGGYRVPNVKHAQPELLLCKELLQMTHQILSQYTFLQPFQEMRNYPKMPKYGYSTIYSNVK